jgi:hypothetical protein
VATAMRECGCDANGTVNFNSFKRVYNHTKGLAEKDSRGAPGSPMPRNRRIPPPRSTPKPEQLSSQPFEPQRRPRRSRASDPATFPTRRSRRAQRCGIPRRAGSSPRSCEISPWRRPWARAVSPS